MGGLSEPGVNVLGHTNFAWSMQIFDLKYLNFPPQIFLDAEYLHRFWCERTLDKEDEAYVTGQLCDNERANKLWGSVQECK